MVEEVGYEIYFVVFLHKHGKKLFVFFFFFAISSAKCPLGVTFIYSVKIDTFKKTV